jgi:hypothetical protein
MLTLSGLYLSLTQSCIFDCTIHLIRQYLFAEFNVFSVYSKMRLHLSHMREVMG